MSQTPILTVTSYDREKYEDARLRFDRTLSGKAKDKKWSGLVPAPTATCVLILIFNILLLSFFICGLI
jgi:hypothetical protein